MSLPFSRPALVELKEESWKAIRVIASKRDQTSPWNYATRGRKDQLDCAILGVAGEWCATLVGSQWGIVEHKLRDFTPSSAAGDITLLGNRYEIKASRPDAGRVWINERRHRDNIESATPIAGYVIVLVKPGFPMAKVSRLVQLDDIGSWPVTDFGRGARERAHGMFMQSVKTRYFGKE